MCDWLQQGVMEGTEYMWNKLSSGREAFWKRAILAAACVALHFIVLQKDINLKEKGKQMRALLVWPVYSMCGE